MAPKLDHIALRTGDIDRAIEFYTRILGLPFLFKQTSSEHLETFAFLGLEGGNLELLQSLDSNLNPLPYRAPLPEPPFTPHLAIGTPDLETLLEILRVSGTPLLKGPLEIQDKVRWVYFADPDGNVLEFVQWL